MKNGCGVVESAKRDWVREEMGIICRFGLLAKHAQTYIRIFWTQLPARVLDPLSYWHIESVLRLSHEVTVLSMWL